MTIRVCAVAVMQVPVLLSKARGQLFLDEVRRCLDIDRPYIVLDCSELRQMDGLAINLLLCCLEEAMKRKGNVKLSALPTGARTSLERAGVNRLFEVFETNAEAVNSFSRVPVHGNSKELNCGSTQATSCDVA